ncbi:MurR/RpiR family transcriptional regulator [uncultured Oscillibacter sp.]|uniref:MurR/RpiR family transcriptional regulator n=1 Tax=uncultured Oscillibacter sp. TaxID=876091 RepID=UPI0026184B2A|nr:MurR/RpiR family transcriptional regulator [uncultured Oscillibacter sp.]
MPLELETRVKNARLTKTEARIANYFLEHRESLYFMTAKDISLAVGISDTSVIRFCRTLGYHGYRELQQSQQASLSQMLEKERYVIPQDKAPEAYQQSRRIGPSQLLGMALANLQKTYEKNRPEEYVKAAELLLQSDHIFVAGFRGSGAAAQYMGVTLSQYCARVQYSGKADSSCIETMQDYGPNDCLVLIGTERYSKMARVLGDMARESGTRLVAVVDKLTSPLAYHADAVFLADISGPTAMNSYLGIFYIVETLHFELSHYCGLRLQERLDRRNRYLSEVELY